MIDKTEARKVVRLFWHNRNEPVAMGCRDCPDLSECGGTRVSAGVFDCLSHCTCIDRSKCDRVCPNNAHYVRRVQEVRGFRFDDIERGKRVPLKVLPPYCHLLYTQPKIQNLISLPFAAVPLSKIFDRVGHGAVALTRSEVTQRFRLAQSTQLVVTGVEQDHRIEKYWGVKRGRAEMIAGIRALDPLIVTVPNFSAFLDAPRHDAMHSLKRIALVWKELNDAAIRTAFHINAVTEYDYLRLAEFLRYHDEIGAVSVEFETGAASLDQGTYHCEQLEALSQRVGRPMTLVYRGEVRWLPMLHKAFPHIMLLNGSTSMRTRKRRRAQLDGDELSWHKVSTAPDETLDSLLSHNLQTAGAWLALRHAALAPLPRRAVGARRRVSTSVVNPEANNKTGQMGFLGDGWRTVLNATTTDFESIVSTS